jgi:hypothetical protein
MSILAETPTNNDATLQIELKSDVALASEIKYENDDLRRGSWN